MQEENFRKTLNENEAKSRDFQPDREGRLPRGFKGSTCSKAARGSPCHSLSKWKTIKLFSTYTDFLEKSRSYFVFLKKQFLSPSAFQFKVERYLLYHDSRCQEREPTVGLLLPNGTQSISPSVHLSWTSFFFSDPGSRHGYTDTFKGALLSKLFKRRWEIRKNRELFITLVVTALKFLSILSRVSCF